MRPWIGLLALPLAFAPLAFAQDTQIGGTLGFGRAEKYHWSSANYVVAGAEACVLCGGRTGLFLEYHHWSRRGSGNGIYPPRSFHFGGAGVRIQGQGERLRPFFDAGFVAGVKKTDSPVEWVPWRITGVIGGGVGFGVAVPVGEHWYVRPFTKVYLVTTNELAIFAGASAGYRF